MVRIFRRAVTMGTSSGQALASMHKVDGERSTYRRRLSRRGLRKQGYAGLVFPLAVLGVGSFPPKALAVCKRDNLGVGAGEDGGQGGWSTPTGEETDNAMTLLKSACNTTHSLGMICHY